MNALWREALRYMGLREADPEMLDRLDAGFCALEAARARHVSAAFPVDTILRTFPSRSLAGYLEGSTGAVLLAATLGAEADRIIRRAEAVDMLHATVLHACAAARIEAHCDAVQAQMPGAGDTRFSPGYGDFPLAMQRPLLEMVQAEKRIGLFLTDGCMLVPSKSITAVIALGKDAPAGCGNKCARCSKADCVYRKGEV